jgi:hypothetical protein
MPRKKTILLLGLATAVIALASFHTYYIRTVAGGDLFWNSDEAYIFLKIGSRGIRLSYLQEFYWRLREALGEVHPPERGSDSVLVLRVTPEEVQRHAVGNMHAGSFDFFNGTIYATGLNKPTGEGLLKWTGNHFEQPSQEELRKLANGALLTYPPSFRNVDGWSKQAGLGLKEFDYKAEFPIELRGEPITLVVKSIDLANEISIDLLRPGRPAERIFHQNQRFRKVSRREYEETFRDFQVF